LEPGLARFFGAVFGALLASREVVSELAATSRSAPRGPGSERSFFFALMANSWFGTTPFGAFSGEKAGGSRNEITSAQGSLNHKL
jgi:hypothetical protein